MILAQCTAIKSDGNRCRANAILDTTKCKFHGGKSLKGIASPTFKTGRYSKYMPKALVSRYEQAADDPELLSMRDNVALIDTRVQDLLTQVSKKAKGASWLDVKKIAKSVRNAWTDGNAEKIEKEIVELELLAEEGYDSTRLWRQISNMLESRRRLSESEQRRLIAMNQSLTVESAMTLVGALSGIIRKYVRDRDTLQKISLELIEITGKRGDPIPTVLLDSVKAPTRAKVEKDDDTSD
jgi:hypothetical protein